jgi:hypothetical protein
LNPARRTSTARATPLMALALLALQSLASCSGRTDSSAGPPGASGHSGATSSGHSGATSSGHSGATSSGYGGCSTDTCNCVPGACGAPCGTCPGGGGTVSGGPGVAGSSGSGASGAGGRAGSTDGGGPSGTGGGGGSVCLSNQIVIYTAPGCGTAAVPVCSDGSGGACASTVCGCDGQVRSDGCYISNAPFAYFQNQGRSGGTCDPGSMGGQSGQGGSGGG